MLNQIHFCSGNPCSLCGDGNWNGETNVKINYSTANLEVDVYGYVRQAGYQLPPYAFAFEDPSLSKQEVEKFLKFLTLYNDDSELAKKLTSPDRDDREIGKLITEHKEGSKDD